MQWHSATSWDFPLVLKLCDPDSEDSIVICSLHGFDESNKFLFYFDFRSIVVGWDHGIKQEIKEIFFVFDYWFV